MNAKRTRLATVLRVRKVQELQAAGDLARAVNAAREADRVLGALHARYDAHRDLDRGDALVPDRLRDRERRVLHAQAIQAGRRQLQDAQAVADRRRIELMARTQAVRAMERLDERARVEEDAEHLRHDVREADDRATGRSAAPPRGLAGGRT